MGSVTTRRRARLRRFATASGVINALKLLECVIAISGDLLTASGDPVSAKRSLHTGFQRRELFPLPVPTIKARDVFGATWPTECYRILDVLLMASARGLNYMYLGKVAAVPIHTNNSSQISVFTTLFKRWLQLAQHLSSDGEPCVVDDTAYQRLVEKGAGGRAVRLKADLVDTLNPCAKVDPLPYVDPQHLSAVTDTDILVPSSADLPESAHFTAGSRGEYVKLTRHQCRIGKVQLGLQCRCAA